MTWAATLPRRGKAWHLFRVVRACRGSRLLFLTFVVKVGLGLGGAVVTLNATLPSMSTTGNPNESRRHLTAAGKI